MSKYRRHAPAVLAQLTVNEAGQVLTKAKCKIQVPVRFSEIGLGQIGIETYTYGLFPLILESGDYAVCNVTALFELNPSKLAMVTIDEVEYHEFHFDAGTVVFKSTDLVKRETLIYNVFDEFIFKGKIPWYVEYDDVGKLFDTAKKHAGSNVGNNAEVIEFVASMISRNKDDRTKFLRETIKSYKDTTIDKIDYVPLASVFWSVNSTMNKLAGSYFNDGVTSALVNPSERAHKIEKILRA